MTDSESIREEKLKNLRSRVRSQIDSDQEQVRATSNHKKSSGLLERSKKIDKSNYRRISTKISTRLDEKGDDETIRMIGAWFIAIGSLLVC